MKRVFIIMPLLLILVVSHVRCKEHNTIVISKAQSLAKQIVYNNKTYVFRGKFDLQKQTLTIPKGCTLVFQGGSVKNGTLFGQDTQIKANSVSIFTNIKIKGEWNVPTITTSWFSDIEKVDDCIKQAHNLVSANHYNKFVVEKGIYWGTVSRNWGSIISTKSNTDYVILGDIRLRPTNVGHSHIFDMQGEYITYHATGTLYGDKYTHDYSSGGSHEWGHAIRIRNANHILIDGFVARECAGDGIEIGNNAQNVIIRNFDIKDTRRQGISVTGVKNCLIEHGVIDSVGGTRPQSGIDIEENTGQFVDSVTIQYVVISNVKGSAFKCFHRVKAGLQAHINNVVFDNVKTNNSLRGFYTNKGCTNIRITNCELIIPLNLKNRPSNRRNLNESNGQDVVISNCKIVITDIPDNIKELKKEVNYTAVRFGKDSKATFKNNTISGKGLGVIFNGNVSKYNNLVNEKPL